MADIDYVGISENFIMEQEGFSPKAYIDASGMSVGYGHFIKKGEEALRGKRLTEEQARGIMRQDIKAFQTPWIKRATEMGLGQNQIIALTSFAYNTGGGAVPRILNLIEKGDKQGAFDLMQEYIHSEGEVVGALVSRRATEGEMVTGVSAKGTWGRFSREVSSVKTLVTKGKWTPTPGFKASAGKEAPQAATQEEILGNSYEALAGSLHNVSLRLKSLGHGLDEEEWIRKLQAEGSGTWQAA